MFVFRGNVLNFPNKIATFPKDIFIDTFHKTKCPFVFIKNWRKRDWTEIMDYRMSAKPILGTPLEAGNRLVMGSLN